MKNVLDVLGGIALLIGCCVGFWVFIFLIFALIHVTAGPEAAKSFGNLFR